MPSFHDVEQAFWSHVWTCTHKHPCKKCCWPWNLTQIPTCWADFPLGDTFYDSLTHRSYPVARFALILTHHAHILPDRRSFIVAHQCDFHLCCNPSHLAIATQRENRNDIHQHGGWWKYRLDYHIFLPTAQPFPLGKLMNTPPLHYNHPNFSPLS